MSPRSNLPSPIADRWAAQRARAVAIARSNGGVLQQHEHERWGGRPSDKRRVSWEVVRSALKRGQLVHRDAHSVRIPRTKAPPSTTRS